MSGTQRIHAALCGAVRGAVEDFLAASPWRPPAGLPGGPVFGHRVVVRRAEDHPLLWEVVRASRRQERAGGADVYRLTTGWAVEGFVAWRAAAADEEAWDALVDAVGARLRRDPTLGGAVSGLAAPGPARRGPRDRGYESGDEWGLQVDHVGRVVRAGGAVMRGALCRLATWHTETGRTEAEYTETGTE